MTSAIRRGSYLLLTPCILALVACQMDGNRPRAEVETPAIAAAAADPAVIDATVRSTILPGEQPLPRTPQRKARPSAGRGNISVNFPTADVDVVARSVLGDILRVPYSIAPGAGRTMSFVTPGAVRRADLLDLFEAALKSAGLGLVPNGTGYVISPSQAAVAPIGSDAIGSGTEIIRLQFINAIELKKVLDPVLPGVVASVDEGQNSVTLSGTTGQRQSAHDIIAQFDVNWLRGMTFGLFVPRRTDSRLIAPELEKLINAPDAPTRGLVRLITMDRINGVLAISRQPQYLEDVRRWLEILDREGDSNLARIFVYHVQNGRARDLAKTINNAMGNGGDDSPSADTQPQGPESGGPGIGVAAAVAPREANGRSSGPTGGGAPSRGEHGQARITADELNNAVIVFGTPREYAVAEAALRQLDVAPVQVMIEAAITEVSLTDDLRFGVQWNFASGSSNFILTEGTTAAAAANLPGFSYGYTGTDIRATLTALEKRTNLKVVSAPKLMVLNNQTAALQVGDQVPILTQTATPLVNTNSTIVNSVEYRDTGVILKVTPRVNASGLVQLDVAQEVSDVTGTSTSSINSPTISTRRVSTTIAVQDNQVVAIGGMFRNAQSFGKNGVPLLSRIPILGALFGNHNDLTRRTELIILLRPHVVRDINDAKAVTEELRAKIRSLEPFQSSGRIP